MAVVGARGRLLPVALDNSIYTAVKLMWKNRGAFSTGVLFRLPGWPITTASSRAGATAGGLLSAYVGNRINCPS